MRRAKLPIHLVIRRHDAPRITVPYGNLERLQVDLAESPRRDLLVDEEAAVLLVVGGKMLDAGADAGGLNAVDVDGRELAGEEGVFAVGFEVAAAKGGSWDTDWMDE